jgi:transketolase
VEHVPSLRLIPNLDVWRPADTLETAVAWTSALRRLDGPAALALSRQVLPVAATLAHVPDIERGGYVLAEAASGAPQAVLIGTGSELQLAVKAQALLAAQGVPVRVVSMPCTNVFDRQGAAYQDAVLPRGLPAVAVEAAQPDFWRKYVGREGVVVGMSGYGESAPAPALYAHFGITAERVVEAVQRCLGLEIAAPATAAAGG